MADLKKGKINMDLNPVFRIEDTNGYKIAIKSAPEYGKVNAIINVSGLLYAISIDDDPYGYSEIYTIKRPLCLPIFLHKYIIDSLLLPEYQIHINHELLTVETKNIFINLEIKYTLIYILNIIKNVDIQHIHAVVNMIEAFVKIYTEEEISTIREWLTSLYKILRSEKNTIEKSEISKIIHRINMQYPALRSLMNNRINPA